MSTTTQARTTISLTASIRNLTDRYGRYLDKVGVTGEGPDHATICATYEVEINKLRADLRRAATRRA